VPWATTEETLVASYNRGMRLLTQTGTVTTCVVEDHRQRASVFVLDDALEAREFGAWVDDNFDAIMQVAESTTSSGRLSAIGQYSIGPLRYLAFELHDGRRGRPEHDRKSHVAACEWIKANYPGDKRYIVSEHRHR
jgi:hydroxymethylglutaryl-CoA reductase (NADPH)